MKYSPRPERPRYRQPVESGVLFPEGARDLLRGREGCAMKAN